MATELELFVGTYEQFLLCYKIKKCDDETFIMERFIASHSHHSSIRCMDVNGKYLATGGSDDRIVIVDLKLNKEVQSINMQKASVNTISFTSDGSHLLSGSEDGQLLAIKVGSWLKENAWNRPHTGKAILKVCIHESGKIAFTLGKDETLRAWDMVWGRQISTTNVKGLSDTMVILDDLQLSPNGETLAMSGFKTVAVISAVCGKLYDELQLQSQITSMWWIDDENLLIGMENGSIEWNNIVESKHENIPKVHTNRVKDMHYLNGFLATICSTGDMTLWSTSIPEKKLTKICTTNDSCRPICVKLISTTENRYKGETKIEIVEEPVVEQLAKSTQVETVAKVIIEVDGNDDDQSNDVVTNENHNIQKTSTEEYLGIVSNVNPTFKSQIETDSNVNEKKEKITPLESSIETDGKVNGKKQKTSSLESSIKADSKVNGKNQKTTQLESSIETDGNVSRKKRKTPPSSIKTNVDVNGKRKKTPTLESPIKTNVKLSGKKQKTPALESLIDTDGNMKRKKQKTQMLEPPINSSGKRQSAEKQSLKKVAEKKPIVTHSADSEDEFDIKDTPKKESKIKSSMDVRLSKRKRSIKESHTIVTPPPKETVTPKLNKKLKNRSMNDSEIDSLAVEDKENDVSDPLEKKKSKNSEVLQKKTLMPGAVPKKLSLNNLSELVDSNKKSKQKKQQITATSTKKVAKKLNLDKSTGIMTRNRFKRNTM